jgi:hypothetical protein
MYKELSIFAWRIARQRTIWTDGELATSVILGVGVGFWMKRDPTLIEGVRAHFSDILTISSIVFGFVMTTLVFYVDVARGWKRTKRVRNAAGKIIDWQVWSIVCLIAQIVFTIALRAVDGRVHLGWGSRPIWYGILVFLSAYCGLQLLNHTMVIWWTFQNSTRLELDATDGAASKDGSGSAKT